jgi:DNA-binding CsgD family transcriptional regulator
MIAGGPVLIRDRAALPGGADAADGAGQLTLVGRERERRLLAERLAAVGTRGAALVLRGEPGIGKSALLEEATHAAAGRGMLVLSACGVRPEAGLAFAGLHQLLNPVLERLGSLPPRQRTALEAAFGSADKPVPEPFVIAVATLRLLREAAAQAPVLLAVEDAHWLDRPTASVLAFAARRVGCESLLLVTAIRDGYRSPLLDAGLLALGLDGLAAGPAGQLLDSRWPCLAPAARAQALAAARGNPLALLELPAAAGDDLVIEAASGRLPLTKRLVEAFATRAAELDPLVRTLLLVAAADESCDLAEVMRATAIAAGTRPGMASLVPAVEAGLVDAQLRALRFRHPLVRSAVYHAADVAARHAAHAALADVLAADPDRQAWHRAAAAAGPDPVVAAGLERAACRARARGGITTAAAAFERAADFSSDPAQRGALLLSAAEAARELGHAGQLARLLAQADIHPLTAPDRARFLWLGDTLAERPVGDPVRIRALVAAVAQATSAGDMPLAAGLLSAAAFRCHCAGLNGSPEGTSVLCAADQAGRAGASAASLLLVQAYAAPVSRGPAVLAHLAGTPPPDDPEALCLTGLAAWLAGDFQRARSLLGSCTTRLRDQGRRYVLAHALTATAWAAIMTCDYRAAADAAAEAGLLAADTAQPLWEAGAWTAQAVLAALHGDHEAVDRLTAQVEESMLPAGAAEPLSLVQYARGLLALSQGRHADAYDQLHRIYQPGDPACSRRQQFAAIIDLAEAAVHAGHRDTARHILERLRPDTGRTPWLRAAAAYAAALLASGRHAETAYQRALAADVPCWPFHRARLHLAYGEWLRRHRRPADSRTHLRTARDAFDALGTAPWGERARRELRASGEISRHPVPDHVEQLTPQEMQIIQLASEGLSNREIGQRLYLSHRTVESHLYHVYPKLGITSRGQLPTVLGRILPA